jgi:hypothetical protein
MRPRGDPEGLAAAGRLLVGAAAEVERIGAALGDLGRDLAGSDAWRGQASAAYRARDRLLEAEIGHAAGALGQAGAGLSELSAGLADAQSLWDRASSLATSAGLVLGPAAPAGVLPLPLASTDPQVVTAARVAEMAREAAEQATAADRSAARRLAEAAATAAQAGAAAGTAAGAAAGAVAEVGGTRAEPGGAGAGAGQGQRERRAEREGGGEREGRSLLGRGLAVANRIGTAVGAGLAAIEARASALARLVRSGREPAASLAAVRALAALERSAFTDTLVAVLPLGGPAITLAANLVHGDEQGEPPLRALVRSLGESLGADVGQRVGMAACGAGTAATEGTGAVLCPAVVIAATSAGATLGGAAAVRVYDTLGSKPSPHPATASASESPS